MTARSFAIMLATTGGLSLIVASFSIGEPWSTASWMRVIGAALIGAVVANIADRQVTK